MSVLLKTRVTAIGPEVADLAEGGVVILFADGSPPELAEVSVLHKTEEGPSDNGPAKGASITLGPVSATAGKRARYAPSEAERPGEVCASEVDTGALVAALTPGAVITIAA